MTSDHLVRVRILAGPPEVFKENFPIPQVTLTKQGTLDYVIFSGACEVNDVAIAENTYKKLTSNSINIKNTDSRDIRIVVVSK